MAKRAAREEKTEVARVWQQRSTRAAILEAARRLAARDDAANLTLARVADEANFSPNTVYAYFVNKSELMLAIVADDLASLAREMRDVFPANEDVVTDDEVQPEAADDAQSAADSDSESLAVEVASDAVDASLPQEPISEIPSSEAEEPTAAIETGDEVPCQAEPDIEAQSVPEHAEAAAVEAEPEPTPEPAEPEPEFAEAAPVEVVDEPVVEAPQPDSAQEAPAQCATEENLEQFLAPEPLSETNSASNPLPDAQPDAHDETISETAEIADAEHSAELRPTGMPLVQKKWVLRQEAGRPETSLDTSLESPQEIDPPVNDQNDETACALATLQESVAKLEARPVDAWLERRLRELERMISSLEERQGTSERSSGTAIGVFDETVRAMQTRLEATEKNRQLDFEGNAKAFAERMDAMEKRQRDALNELRNLTMMSSSRLDVLESGAQGKAAYGHIEVVPVVESPAVVAEAPVEEAVAPTEIETPPAAETGTSYLSQARRSAMAAAAQTVAQPNDSMQRFASTMSSFKSASSGSRYMIVGGIALLVILLGVGLALKRQAADRGAEAPVQIASSSQGAHGKLQPGQKMAPQIRLVSLASRGNADAQLLLGLEYLDGAGAAKNESEAAQWISRAAAHGNAVAQYWLATLYANGRGVKADPALAMHWYEEAAMQGNRKAMHQLAVSYAEGWGASRNYAEAARWFSRAASLGYVDSAFNLGVLYERGLGMPQSLLDAYKWYSIAAAMGDKGSPPRLAVLKTQMKPDDIADAAQAASSFTPDSLDQTANNAPQIAQLPKS